MAMFLRPIFRPLLISLAIGGSLAGCLQSGATWYEERCLRYGFKRGSADFEACVARDKAWLEEDRARAARPGGQGGP